LAKLLIKEKSRLKKLTAHETKNYLTWRKVVRNVLLAIALHSCAVLLEFWQADLPLFPNAVNWLDKLSFFVLMVGVAMPLLWTFALWLPPLPTLNGTVKREDLDDYAYFRFVARNFLINYYRSKRRSN